MCEVDPRGGVPGLGWGCEERLGRGCRGFQVGWHGGVPCLGLCLSKLAQIDLASCATCIQFVHAIRKDPGLLPRAWQLIPIPCYDVMQQDMVSCFQHVGLMPNKYDALQNALSLFLLLYTVSKHL